MRHYTAARKGDEGWHYVSLGRDGGHPIGNCAEHAPHATEAEARECYAEFERDRMELRRDAFSNWSDCSECGAPTKHAADRRNGFSMAPLCDEHLTVEMGHKHLHLDRPAGDQWRS